MTFKLSLVAAAVVVGLSTMPAMAQLHVVPNGGYLDSADPEAQLAGGPGMPTNIAGYTHPAQLVVDISDFYRFTYLGSGDSADTNTFTVGTDIFTTIGPGGTTSGSTAVFDSFTQYLTAGTIIPFTFTNVTTGCSVANGFDSTPISEACHYLLAPGTVPTTVPDLGSVSSVYIGFADLPGGSVPGFPHADHDYQDLTVLVERVPEPASMALLAAGLLGLGAARRRRA